MQRHLPHTSTRLSTPETRRLVGQGGNMAEPETTRAVAAATTKYHGYHHGNFALIAETGRDGPGQRVFRRGACYECAHRPRTVAGIHSNSRFLTRS